jgi:hypothetical protein
MFEKEGTDGEGTGLAARVVKLTTFEVMFSGGTVSSTALTAAKYALPGVRVDRVNLSLETFCAGESKRELLDDDKKTLKWSGGVVPRYVQFREAEVSVTSESVKDREGWTPGYL